MKEIYNNNPHKIEDFANTPLIEFVCKFKEYKMLEVGRKTSALDVVDRINDILMESGIKMQFILEEKNNKEIDECLYFSFMPFVVQS